MTQRVDNYHIQMQQAKKRFLTYDQQELIQRCGLQFDENYLYTKLLSQNYRIHRRTGDMERFHQNAWVDGNTFNEVMTVLDWLCDSRPDRYITHRWINVVTHGHYFHGNLQEDVSVHHAKLFERQPEAFGKESPVHSSVTLLNSLTVFVCWCSCGKGMMNFRPGFGVCGMKIQTATCGTKPPGLLRHC